jgi:O-methyltransferase
MSMLGDFIQPLFRIAGYELRPVTSPPALEALKPFWQRSLKETYADVTEQEWEIYFKVREFTLLSLERIVANIRAIDYVLRRDIPGDIVECGIWRGGSTMAMALAALKRPRNLWMYDTFSGMTDPTAADIDTSGRSALTRMKEDDARKKRSARGSVHCLASLEDVQANMQSTGYPSEMLKFIEGPVERTIPKHIPERIALMRIDTDWYESTKHELEHLFPRLVPGGVLIIDDYGHWKGSKKAVDEFLGGALLLNRTDSTGVVAVKQDRARSQ